MTPDEFPGIEVRRALEGLRGNTSLLARIIDAFRRETSGIVERMCEAADRRDFAALRRDAHNLKGLALTLGATPLAAMARGLDRELGGLTPEQVRLACGEIETELARVRESSCQLEQILSDVKPAGSGEAESSAPDPNEAISLIPGLLQLLSRNSLDARSVFQRVELHLRGGEREQELAEIATAITRLDFRTAEAAVAALTEKLGADLSSKPEATKLSAEGEGAP